MNLPNAPHQARIFLSPQAWFAILPGVIATSRNLQATAHQSYRVGAVKILQRTNADGEPIEVAGTTKLAVELVLESGSLSAEHILNVVARLTASEPPPSVETHLSLKEAPVANTARYDRLRGQAEGVGHA